MPINVGGTPESILNWAQGSNSPFLNWLGDQGAGRLALPEIQNQLQYAISLGPLMRALTDNLLASLSPDNIAARGASVGREAESSARGRFKGLVAQRPEFAGGAELEARNVGNEAQAGFSAGAYSPQGRDIIQQLVMQAITGGMGNPLMSQMLQGLSAREGIKGSQRQRVQSTQQGGLGGIIGSVLGMIPGNFNWGGLLNMGGGQQTQLPPMQQSQQALSGWGNLAYPT